ncbi:MAG: MFS transporter, partial [Gammaproteobacteria bacterium]
MNNSKAIKLGPLWFTPGVTKTNLGTMLFAGFGTMSMVSFMSFMQPYVLTELLHIPREEQGSLIGNLHAFQEIIFIVVAGFVGALSDKLGRPIVYGCGFIVVSAGYALYPVADSVLQLYIVRALFAVGVGTVAVMLSACTVDYIQERSRGRWVGMMSIFNGLGIVAMSGILSRLPSMYENIGNDVVTAGRFSFWTVASLCLVVGFVLVFGLYRGPGSGEEDDHAHILKKLAAGAKVALDSPRLAIAYGGAFIGRGDFAVVGTFFSLWLTQVGIDQGMSAADAIKKAGLLFAMIQICALIWAPFMGIITDRIRRMTAVSIGLLIAGSGYLLMSQVPDPFGPYMYPAAVLLGMGETSVIVSVAALLGQETKTANRGAIVGVFGLMGGLGILVTTFLGGQLFDGIGRTAPFAMMG